MFRRALLVALLVCTLGATIVAVQPAAAGDVSDPVTLDDPAEQEYSGSDDGASDGDDGTESTPRDDQQSDDGRDEGPDRWRDRWSSDRENQSEDHQNSDSEDGGEANETENDSDGYDDPNARDGADRGNRSDDGENWSWIHAHVRAVTGESADGVVAHISDEVDEHPGPGSASLPDRAGVLERVDGSDGPEPRTSADGRTQRRADGRTAPPDGGEEAADPTTVRSDPAPSEPGGNAAQDDDARHPHDGGSAGGETPAPPGGAGAGAGLILTVGYLGGTRTAVTQANLLAATPADSVRSLRSVARQRLESLPDVPLPPVFGYSRHDSSDPLENDTRAAIYEQVRESPGIYHARLAEETDVAVETVRYHCRILAEEGLVEPRKHRGKRRLYPVSMDDEDPALGAAMADSAAADVLAAIDSLEPVTLSAIAEHVECAPSTVTYHLDRLEEDGLVTRERDGGEVQIRLRRDARSALQTSVADD